MKIVYFNYIADAVGPMIRTLELAKATSDNGVEVALYFMHKGFRPPAFVYERIHEYQSENLKIHFSDRFESTQKESEEKTKNVQAAGEPRIRLRGLIKQIVLSLRTIPDELKIIRAEKPDAVMARPDHAFSFCVSSIIKRKPLILEADGPIEELALYWGISSKLLVKLDTLRVKLSSSVLVISGVCRDLLISKSIPEEKIYMVPNGTHPEEFAPNDSNRESLLNSLKLNDCRVIGYSGNQRVWHGLPDLLKSSMDSQLMEDCQIPQDIFENQIVFTGRLSYWDMAKHIDLCNIMVMPYQRLPLFYFSPMRMFEAMSLGKAIIASEQGQMLDILSSQKNSVRFFDPDKPDDLNKVLNASAYDEKFINAGDDNRNFLIESHTWFQRGTTIKNALIKLLDSK